MEDNIAVEIIELMISSIFPAALTIFTAIFVLPLTRLRLYLSLLVTAGIMAAVLLSLLPPISFYVIVPALFVISTSQWRALSGRNDFIFLIESGASQDALLVREERRFEQNLAMCPLGSLFKLKANVIRRLTRNRCDVVLLRPRKVGSAYVCQCPAELALARASNPREIEPFKSVELAYRRPSWTLNLAGAENEVSINGVMRIGSAFLLTNVLSHGGGLFGFSSTPLPRLDDWRSLCAYETLLRSSPALDFAQIIDELKRLCEDAPEQSNILAYLTFRLKLFENRYGPKVETKDVRNAFELAVYGNLRAVALEFNKHSFDRSFASSAWATNLLHTLFAYLTSSTLYTHNADGGPISKEMSWLVGLMVRVVEVHRENRLYVPIGRYDRAEDDAKDAAVEAFISGLPTQGLTTSLDQFLSLLTSFKMPVPSPATDEGEARRIAGLPPEKLLEETRRWAVAQPELRDHRVQLVLDVVFESGFERGMRYFEEFAGLFMRTVSGADIGVSEVLPGARRWLDGLERVSSTRLALSRLFGDPVLKTLMNRRLAAENDLGELMVGALKKFLALAGRDEQFVQQAIVRMVEDILPQRLKPTFHALRGFSNSNRSAPVFLSSAINVAKAYSFDEFIYGTTLICLFFDTDSDDDSFQKAIDKAEQSAVKILRDERVYDRAALLSISAEFLSRWRPETADTIWRELEKAGLPVPTWKGALVYYS